MLPNIDFLHFTLCDEKNNKETFFNSVFAGDKNEIRFSYGYSGMEWLHVNFDLSGDYQCKDETSGTLSLSYHRRIKEKMSIGGGVIYMPLKYNYCTYNNFKQIKTSSIEHLVIPFAKFDYRYIIKPEFELYSSASLLGLAPHLTVIGFKTGSKHAFFGELGIGLGQIASAGYALRF